jgi:hypothetical protein
MQSDEILLPAMEITPEKINGGAVEEHSDDEYMTHIEIANNGEGPLEVLELKGDAEWMTFETDVSIPAGKFTSNLRLLVMTRSFLTDCL